MLNELSPIRKIPAGRRRAMLNKRQRSLPQQLEGFVEKRLTDPRRQCETLLRTYLSKMDQVLCQDIPQLPCLMSVYCHLLLATEAKNNCR